MDVYIYAPWIYQRGGAERVVIDLAKSLNAKKIFTSHFEPENTFDDFKSLNVVQVGYIPVVKNFVSLTVVSLKLIFQKLPIEKDSVLVVSTGGFGEFITFRNRVSRVACFCHTPLRAIHDEVFQKDYFRRRGLFFRFLFEFFRIPYVFFERLAFSNFDVVIANSLNTRSRLASAGLGDSVVVYPGVESVNAKPVFKNFFLAAGRFISYKNFELAIRSFIIFKERGGNKNFKLVLAGGLSDINNNYFSLLKRLARGRGDIIFVVNPSESRLKKLYSECFAFLFPALNEDFGIVPVEAMSFGKQVIALNEGGVKETVVNGVTGRLCAGDESFADAMINLRNSTKTFNECVKRAGAFSKTSFSEKIRKAVLT